jgi:hypothetical protein
MHGKQYRFRSLHLSNLTLCIICYAEHSKPTPPVSRRGKHSGRWSERNAASLSTIFDHPPEGTGTTSGCCKDRRDNQKDNGVIGSRMVISGGDACAIRRSVGALRESVVNEQKPQSSETLLISCDFGPSSWPIKPTKSSGAPKTYPVVRGAPSKINFEAC